jgi:acylphosphatase
MHESAAHIIVHGRVQGVFYRANTQSAAQELRLAGWVRNRADGTVEIHAEGVKADVESLIEWCRKGPPAASVTGVTVEWVSPQGLGEFNVR